MYFRGTPYAVGRAGSLKFSIEKALRDGLPEQQSTQAWLRLQRTFSVLSLVCSEAVEVLWFARWGAGAEGRCIFLIESCAGPWNLNFVKRPRGSYINGHNVGTRWPTQHAVPTRVLTDSGIYDDCWIIGPILSKRMPWIWIQFWRKPWDPMSIDWRERSTATQSLSESRRKETDCKYYLVIAIALVGWTQII